MAKTGIADVAKEDITELTRFEASVVSGVTNPANGTPFIVLKSTEPMHPASVGSSFIPNPVVKSEAEEIEELVTKGLCPDLDCDACLKILVGVPGELAIKAKLTARQRNAIPNSDFAYTDGGGGRHLPIHDESHVRNAISRFNQTKFDSPRSQGKAGRKIKSKARSMGIDVGAGSNVNKEAWDAVCEAANIAKSAVGPGVPRGALNTPKQKGAITRSSEIGSGGRNKKGNRTDQSGIKGPMTQVCPTCNGKGGIVEGKPGAGCHACDGRGFIITDHKKVVTNALPKRVAHQTLGVFKATPDDDDDSACTEPDADDGVVTITEDGPVEKGKGKIKFGTKAKVKSKGKENAWVTGDNPNSGKDLDADSVDRGLMEAVKALNLVRSGQEIDISDMDSVASAVSFVARLIGPGVAKGAESTIRPETAAALRTARIQLTALTGGDDTIQIDQGEGKMPTTVTKAEFDGLIAKAAKKGGKAAFAAMRDADEKAEKEAKAAAATSVKKSKSSNNKGEVTEGALRAKGRRKITENLRGLQMTGQGKVRKQKKSKVAKETTPDPDLEAIKKSLEDLTSTVGAFAKRPRSGGPILDGQARGAFPATERGSGNVTKSAEEQEIEKLEKSLDEAMQQKGPEAAYRVSELSNQLTMARLYQAHQTGQI